MSRVWRAYLEARRLAWADRPLRKRWAVFAMRSKFLTQLGEDPWYRAEYRVYRTRWKAQRVATGLNQVLTWSSAGSFAPHPVVRYEARMIEPER